MKIESFLSDKKNQRIMIGIFIILFAAFQLTGFFGFYSYGWDESVYLHTSEYIKTGGNEGFLENLRPAMFPVMLAPFSGDVLLSRAFVLVLSAIALWIAYLIGRKHLSLEFGWIFPVLLAVFPYYYISSGSILTEIPALLFNLMSVYFLLERRYFYSGLTAFIAFFIRFNFGIYLPILAFGIFLLEKSQNQLRQATRFFLGVLAGFPLFLINAYMFRSLANDIVEAAFYPVINQLKDNLFSPYIWLYKGGPFYYISYLFKWSPLVLFSGIGLFFLIRNLRASPGKNGQLKKKIFFFILMALPLLYLIVSPHKETRYIMLAISWIVFFICFGIIETLETFRKKEAAFTIIRAGIIVLFAALLINSVVLASRFNYAPEGFYRDYLFALHEAPSGSTVLTSTPMIKTHAKIEVGYYNDAYFYEKIAKNSYDYVYYAPSSFPCKEGDAGCLGLRKKTEDYLNGNYRLYLSYSFSGSDFFIFSKE